MRLFSRKSKQNIEDETLAALLTEDYDARLDVITSGAASKAFPLRGRCPSAHTGADEVSNAVSIHSASVRRIRWQGAAAAILVLATLGGGGWLLHRQLTRKTAEATPADSGYAYDRAPAPKNCHAELKNGETVYVLDSDYDGVYALQKANTRFVGDVITENWPLPGFEQQIVMSYADYAAYCETWCLPQTYTDPDQNYLVYAWGGFQNELADSPRLADVVWTDDAATVFLCKPELKQGYAEVCIRYPVPWVLTVPVGQKTGTVKVQPVTALADLKPAHIHYADLGGETVYVLDDEDAEYEGEYDLQEADLWEGPGLTTSPVSLEEEAPEGFSQKTVMTYEAYAAYCEKWGLEQKFKDPDRRYLVYATAWFSFAKRQPCLTDVKYFGQTAYLFLYYKALYHSIEYRSAWVLTVPTDAEVTNLELPRLLTQADYDSESEVLALRAKNRMETLPDGSIRIIGYAHVTAVRVGEQNGGVPVEFEVQIDGETVCVWVEDTELLNPDGTSFTPVWSAAAPAGGESSMYVCIRAEGCTRIEDRGLFDELTDDFPDYKAARLIVCCDEDPDKAFAAVCKPLDAAFNALSLTEIRDRVRNPETYRDELRSEDWAGCVHKSALFDYGAGYLYAIWDTYDKHLYGAWLFDRSLKLRETVAGWSVELPPDEELKQTLESLTSKEAEARYGAFLFDGGSGLYLPTWFTSDGRLIVVNATVPLHLVSSEDILAPVRSSAEPAVPD